MIVKVNDEKIELKGTSIADLIKQLGYENQRIALEINKQIVPKSEHHNFILNKNDKVEIIKAVGGG